MRFIGFILGAVGAGAVLAGCGTTARPEAPRPPAMPTIGAAPSAPTAEEPEEKLIGEIIQAARSGRADRAVAKLNALPEPAARRRIAVLSAQLMLQHDLPSAGALAVTLEPGPLQAEIVELVAEAAAGFDLRFALKWVETIGDPVTRGVALRVIAAMGVFDGPRGLLQRIDEMKTSPARDDARTAAAAAWARRDADAALDWLAAQGDEPRLRAAVFFAVAETQPKRASGLVARLPEGRDRRLLVSAVTQNWVAQDRAAAVAWAADLAPGPERDAAYAGIETGLGVPAVRRRGGAPGQRGIASRGFGGGAGATAAVLASASSPEFEAWLATQPPGRDRDEALVEFVRQRGALDTGAIGHWLASLPGGPARDRAREIYLEGRLASSPAEAAAWLRSLPRAEVGDAAVERVARRWLVTNPDAAALWLRDAPIPDFQKERILREAGR